VSYGLDLVGVFDAPTGLSALPASVCQSSERHAQKTLPQLLVDTGENNKQLNEGDEKLFRSSHWMKRVSLRALSPPPMRRIF
jgi:hypothetical protein